MKQKLITIQQWRARCRFCKWEGKKDYPNREAAIMAYHSHARKHMAIESVERSLEDIGANV